MADEEKLLRRLKKKQRGALEQTMEVYTPYLGTVLYNMAGTHLSREDAEEIISDVFLSLWRNAERLDPAKGTIRSYIAASARNAAIKRLQKQKDCASLDELGENTLHTNTDDADSGEVLWQAVMSLGEPDNEIFVRYYQYDEWRREIAQAMTSNLSTVTT